MTDEFEPLTVDEYARRAGRTDQRSDGGSMAFPLLGLFGETGSLLSEVKKKQRDRASYLGYAEAVVEELGDVLLYLVAVTSRAGARLSEVFVSAAPERVKSAADGLPLFSLQPEVMPRSGDPSPAFERTLLKLAGQVGLLVSEASSSDASDTERRLVAIARTIIQAADEAGLTLEAAAVKNLLKIEDRWPLHRRLPDLFDDHAELDERLPRQLGDRCNEVFGLREQVERLLSLSAEGQAMTEISGKVAVVLGCSASGGTGWAIAERLAASGAKVVVAARRRAPLEVLASKIDGVVCVCDVGNPVEIAALAQAATDAFGSIDIAVNAAGLPVIGPIAEAETDALQQALNVNYLGSVHFIKHMAAKMNVGGSIVLISSSSAHQPVLPYFAYACAKAAADCLVRYAALEYGPRGIRVNSVVPGPIKSDLAAEIFSIPGMEEAFAREVPLGRIGQPGDYADAVLWLAGPAFVTGLNLPVSGGLQLTRSPRTDELPIGLTPG